MSDPSFSQRFSSPNPAPPAGDPYGPPEPDLRTYLHVLARRKWFIVLVTAGVVVAAFAISLIEPAKYTAVAEVLLQPNQSVQLNTNSSSSGEVLTPADITTQIQLVTSAPVKASVSKATGTYPAPPISVSEVGLTNVINVSATSSTPAAAARIANLYANNYISFQRQEEVSALLAAASQIQSKITDLDAQIATLDNQLAAAPVAQQASLAAQRTALVNQEAAFKAEQAQFQVTSALQNGGAQVVTPAIKPLSKSSPRPKRNAALGLALGLILGVGGAFGLEYLDDSIRTKEDLEKAGGGLSVLGLIPEVVGWKDEATPRLVTAMTPNSATAEAYKSLRTSIQFVSLDRPIRIVQLTSPVAQEGKTTTLSNLGTVFAQANQRVVMVCCDLRRPRLHTFFGLDNRVGLTSVLLGHSSLADAVQPALPDQDHLWLLASGPPPPNPSELLASPLTGEVLRTLASEFDMVLVDSPPVLPVTDAAVLSAHVDGVVLVAVAGLTGRKQVQRSLELLSQVNGPVVGTVLNGVPMGKAYGYAYRYGGGYASYHSHHEEAAPYAERGLQEGSGGH